MSLKDQLLKAGVATKKQARRAGHEARQARKKSKKKGVPQENDALKAEIAAQQEAKKERDRQLNLQVFEQQQRRAVLAQVVDIITSNYLNERRAEEPYYFVFGDQKEIKRLNATAKQVSMLAEGRLGIAFVRELGEDFYLISQEYIHKISDLVGDRGADFIACHHKESA